MTLKEQLILELEDAPETLITAIWEFIERLKLEEAEDAEDLADARAALGAIATEGTVPWDEVKKQVGLQ